MLPLFTSLFVSLALCLTGTLRVEAVPIKINIYNQTIKRFQGDIASVPLHPSRTRNGILFDREKWTGAVIYYINGVAQNRQALVTRAMQSIEQSSCIRFVQRSTQSNYVHILTTADGCYSSVGMVGGRQVLSLQDDSSGSCMTFDTVVHEILHAVGLYHEQSRYDRDRYLRVLPENIETGMADQFDIVPRSDSSVYDTPYDFTSVMHYDQFAFSKNRQPTMLPQPPYDRYRATMGNVQKASYYDFLKINRIYKCPGFSGTGGTGQNCVDTNDPKICTTYRNSCNTDANFRNGCFKTCTGCTSG